MSSLKWSGNEIIAFLNIFRNYPCLWNVTSENYTNRNVKEESYNYLLEELGFADIPGTLESVKKKIKSLRDTYRKELKKIRLSKKSGASDVYKPKLVWFSAAETIWHGTVVGGDSFSNLDMQQCSTPEVDRESSNDTSSDDDCKSEQEVLLVEMPESPPLVEPPHFASNTTLSRKRPCQQTPPPPLSRRPKSRFENNSQPAMHADTDDQYERFAKHVASQLRELPLRSFIVLQSKIQNLVTEERLAAL